MFESLFKSRKRRFAQSSYAQCGEDLIAAFYFDCFGVKSGTYLDIGAHDPHWLNNTFFFYRRGWRGVNIDAQEGAIRNFEKYRPDDINIAAAVSGAGGERCLRVFDATALSTASDERTRLYQSMGHRVTGEIKLITARLVDILERVGKQDFDLVSIDVEGMERELLEALFNAGTFPRMLICETALYAPRLADATKCKDLVSWVQAKGYSVYADTFVNTIFIREQEGG